MSVYTMESSRAVKLLLLISVAIISVTSAQHQTKDWKDTLIRDFDPYTTPEWPNPDVTQHSAAGVVAPAAAPSTASNVANSQVYATSPVPNYNRDGTVTGNVVKIDDRISDVIANSVLHFAHQLGQQLTETSYSKTEVFSPTSVMSALALLMLGAKGRSYQELKRLFGLDYDQVLANDPSKFHQQFGFLLEDVQHIQQTAASRRKNVNWRYTSANNNIRGKPMAAAAEVERKKAAEQVVRVANGLFAQTGYSLNPDYSAVISSVYHGQLEPLNFRQYSAAARDHINDWVSLNTNGKIPNIINGDIASSTSIIMASALYFKAFWENTFFEAATQLDSFYPDGPTQPAVEVKMMATGGVFPFYDSVEHDCRIIGLPYKGNTTTMYVIQPNHSTRNRLRQMQKYLDSQKIEEMISRMTQSSAVVAFPKMHIVRELNMKQFLSRLGVNDIFFNGLSDLSLIGTGEQSSLPRHTATSTASSIPNQMSFGSSKTQQRPATVLEGTRRYPVLFPARSSDATEQQEGIKGGSLRSKREVGFDPLVDRRLPRLNSLQRLEEQRNTISDPASKSDLFVEDIVHKVDFDVNEQGTEAAAATLTYLRRSGTDVLFRAETPFMFLIRHDPTKLVLFYGLINEPEL